MHSIVVRQSYFTEWSPGDYYLNVRFYLLQMYATLHCHYKRHQQYIVALWGQSFYETNKECSELV